MFELVPYDPDVHRDEYVQMSKDYMTWIFDQLDKNYDLNSRNWLEVPFEEWLDGIVDPFENLEPPQGILYMIESPEGVVGMGAMKKLRDDCGEIKRMYNCPEYRGQGLGRKMIVRLLEDGKRFGCKSFKLDTPKWAKAAQGLYKSVGFVEGEKYPESEIPELFQKYWMWMEKVLTK